MSGAAGWTCAACGTANAGPTGACLVCGTVVGQEAPVAQATVPVVARVHAGDQGQGGPPDANSAGAAAATDLGSVPTSGAPPEGRSPRSARTAVLVGGLVLLAVLATVAVMSLLQGGDEDPEVVADRRESANRGTADPEADEAGPGGAEAPKVPDSAAEAERTAPDTTTTTEPAAPVMPTVATTLPRPATTVAPPATVAPATVVPTTSATVAPPVTGAGPALDDPSHLVRFALPAAMTTTKAFDGASARWAYGTLTLDYSVQTGASLSDADARYENLRSTFTSAPAVDSRPATSAEDGRYALSGVQSDQTIIYERAKIRCGDLVWYRLTAPPGSDMAIGRAIPDLLYDDSAEGDSMGGVHAYDC